MESTTFPSAKDNSGDVGTISPAKSRPGARHAAAAREGRLSSYISLGLCIGVYPFSGGRGSTSTPDMADRIRHHVAETPGVFSSRIQHLGASQERGGPIRPER